jgi:acyl-CoA reductase-like NAD-dependent aldehyde dehydrogenase
MRCSRASLSEARFRVGANVASQDELAAFQLFIGGRSVDALAERTFISRNPATGKPWAEVAEAGPEDVDVAVDSCREAFESAAWRSMTPSNRGLLLHRLGDLLW